MEGKIENLVGVTPFIIVPGDDLVEIITQTNTSLVIEDGGSGVMHEVLRDDFFLGVSQNTLEFTFRSFLHGFTDVSIGGTLFESDGKINDRDVDGRNSEGHTSELTLQLRENETNSLSSTSGGGNDVGGGSSTSSPVLTTLGGTIDNQLGGGGGVDGGHETFNDTELVIEDLSDGGKTVGGTRSIGNDVLGSLVILVVNTINEGGGVVLSGSREDNLLSTTLDVSKSLFLSKESTSGFTDEVSTSITPL